MKAYIYQIENKTTGKSYIGQTVDINRRIQTHKRELRRCVHTNSKLQNAWIKYGEPDFNINVWEFNVKNPNELDSLECAFIEKFNSMSEGYNILAGGSKPPSIQKVDNSDIVKFLCIQEIFGDGYGKTCEELFGWSKGTASNAKRGLRYSEARETFLLLSHTEKKEMAEKVCVELDVKDVHDKRQLRQGGSKDAYKLNKEDIYFAFTAQELGYSYVEVAKYFNLSKYTVKDWFNGRSRKKERKEFDEINKDEKMKITSRVKTAELSGKA